MMDINSLTLICDALQKVSKTLACFVKKHNKNLHVSLAGFSNHPSYSKLSINQNSLNYDLHQKGNQEDTGLPKSKRAKVCVGDKAFKLQSRSNLQVCVTAILSGSTGGVITK